MHTPIITHMDADKHSESAIVIKMSCRKEQEFLHSMVCSSRLFLESCERVLPAAGGSCSPGPAAALGRRLHCVTAADSLYCFAASSVTLTKPLRVCRTLKCQGQDLNI